MINNYLHYFRSSNIHHYIIYITNYHNSIYQNKLNNQNQFSHCKSCMKNHICIHEYLQIKQLLNNMKCIMLLITHRFCMLYHIARRYSLWNPRNSLQDTQLSINSCRDKFNHNTINSYNNRFLSMFYIFLSNSNQVLRLHYLSVLENRFLCHRQCINYYLGLNIVNMLNDMTNIPLNYHFCSNGQDSLWSNCAQNNNNSQRKNCSNRY